MYRRVSGELKPKPQEVWTRLGGANRSRLSDAPDVYTHTYIGGLLRFPANSLRSSLGILED